jgi:U3 small nucleolar RNA-associated protein 14
MIVSEFIATGSWGGRGTKKSQPKPHLIKKVPGVAPAARADAGKARVIISERKDKKAGGYMVKDLPHPYTTKAQFESSLEMPIGPECNTRMGFQKSTLAKVVKKVRYHVSISYSRRAQIANWCCTRQMGTVIDPIEKLF